MKTNKNITLDTTIVEKLKKIDNASSLIEQLLKDYFANNKANHEKMEQKKADLKTKRKEIKQLKLEIKQISTISTLEKQLNIKKMYDLDESKTFEEAFIKWGSTNDAKKLKGISKLEYFRKNIYKEVK